jgi:hypothetical protein
VECRDQGPDQQLLNPEDAHTVNPAVPGAGKRARDRQKHQFIRHHDGEREAQEQERVAQPERDAHANDLPDRARLVDRNRRAARKHQAPQLGESQLRNLRPRQSRRLGSLAQGWIRDDGWPDNRCRPSRDLTTRSSTCGPPQPRRPALLPRHAHLGRQPTRLACPTNQSDAQTRAPRVGLRPPPSSLVKPHVQPFAGLRSDIDYGVSIANI